jgi:ribosome biogenesis GTPase
VSPSERFDLKSARVVEEQRGAYRVAGDFNGWAEVSGRFRHETMSPAEFPVVGDWVEVAGATGSSRAIIERRLERRSAISRTAPTGEQQIIAANVDIVFVVASLTHDRNARRVERYLTAVWDGGAVPVVLLNKADLVEDPDAAVDELRARLPFVDVHAVSAIESKAGLAGLKACATYLQPNVTIALVGPSGAGKSTIVNRLAGEDRQKTGAVREADSKGRHTTTARQLIELPSGALLIDTPGLRELQLWGDESAVDAAFDDIASLAGQCRFADCQHDTEPGCAVLAAVEDGTLTADRLEHYRRLLREAAFEARKHDKTAAAEHKRQWKRMHQANKMLYRLRDKS